MNMDSVVTNQYKALQDAVFAATKNSLLDSRKSLSEALVNAQEHLRETSTSGEGETEWIRLLNLYSIGAKVVGTPFFVDWSDRPPKSSLLTADGATHSSPTRSESVGGDSMDGLPETTGNQTQFTFPDLKPSLPKRSGLHQE